MCKQLFRSIYLLIITLLSYSCIANAAYLVTDLGLSGGTGDLNDQGVVVMTYNNEAYIWENGVLTNIGTLDGNKCEAFSINNSNTVVGIIYEEEIIPFRNGFVYQNGTMEYIDNDPLVENTALDINDGGIIVGWHRDASGYALGYYYDTTMHMMGTINNVDHGSYAMAINDNNRIAGLSYIADIGDPSDSEYHAFYYDISEGTMHDMGVLGTGLKSMANEINELNQIVGYSDTTVDGDIHAFFYENNVMIDLGTLDGGVSYGSGINDSGVVVGSSDGSAFIWEMSTGMIDLNDLLPANSGWELTGAGSINNSGQIFGAGWYEGELHRFLLTPTTIPEPLSIILLMCALFGYIRHRG